MSKDRPPPTARGAGVVVGIGETEMSKASPSSALELAVEASLAALADAGIEPRDVDGLLRFGAPFETVSHASLIRSLGVTDLGFYGEIPLGGEAAAGMIHHAVAALASGRASVVLCYRAIKQSGGNRFGRADQQRHGGSPEDDVFVEGDAAFTWPYWMMAPAHLFALWATRYLHEAGISEQQFRQAVGRVALDQRRYANSRPGSLLHARPLTWEQFDGGRMISWPLNLFMLCLENDGAAAVVLTTCERARDCAGSSVSVLASSQSLAPLREPFSFYADDLLQIFPAERARRLWMDAGIAPADVDVAELYDATSLMTLLSLELWGFLERGRAWQHVTEHGIGLGSPLPVNTHGGHLSDGYVHGMTGILEAVRQVRGSATNQVAGARVAFFGALSGSSVVLSTPELATSLDKGSTR